MSKPDVSVGKKEIKKKIGKFVRLGFVSVRSLKVQATEASTFREQKKETSFFIWMIWQFYNFANLAIDNF